MSQHGPIQYSKGFAPKITCIPPAAQNEQYIKKIMVVVGTLGWTLKPELFDMQDYLQCAGTDWLP